MDKSDAIYGNPLLVDIDPQVYSMALEGGEEDGNGDAAVANNDNIRESVLGDPDNKNENGDDAASSNTENEAEQQ